MQRPVWEHCLHVQRPWGKKRCAYLEKGKKAGVFGEWSTLSNVLDVGGGDGAGEGEGEQNAGQRPDHEDFVMPVKARSLEVSIQWEATGGYEAVE